MISRPTASANRKHTDSLTNCDCGCDCGSRCRTAARHVERTTLVRAWRGRWLILLGAPLALLPLPAAPQALTFPPEWAPHQAVWMGWSEDTAHHATQLEMIRAMAPHVPIRLMVTSQQAQAEAETALRTAGVDPAATEYVLNEIPNFWTRDPGPLFLTDGQRLTIARFEWDDFGYPNELRLSDPRLLRRGELGGDVAGLLRLPTVETKLVAEGGGLEVSSDVLLSYRQTAMQRNPGVPIEEIEREYLRMYGKKKMVWLSRSPLSDRVFSGPKLGNVFGMGANGHIDEFVRFVNDSTILIAQIDSADAAAHALSAVDREILLENLAELRAARSANGRPFHIIMLPSPSLHLYAWKGPLPLWAKEKDSMGAWYRSMQVGDEMEWVPALSYLNFFITNGVVLVPAYWHEGLPRSEQMKDQQVRDTLQRLFPDRRIVQINPLKVNFSGGGMHCITQQEPRVAR